LLELPCKPEKSVTTAKTCIRRMCASSAPGACQVCTYAPAASGQGNSDVTIDSVELKGDASSLSDSTGACHYPEKEFLEAESAKASDSENSSTERGSDPASSDEEAGSCGPFSLERSLFIIDWDDTILPTTWLGQHGLLRDEDAELSDKQEAQLSALAEAVMETLDVAGDLGKVVLVTNGVEGWIEHSCLRFLPTLASTVRWLPKVSARSEFQPLGIECPTEWKSRAFEREIKAFAEMLDGDSLSVISLGDSMCERQALLSEASKVPSCFAKSMKLAERPSIERLTEEHENVVGMLQDVTSYDGDLDLDIGAMC